MTAYVTLCMFYILLEQARENISIGSNFVKLGMGISPASIARCSLSTSHTVHQRRSPRTTTVGGVTLRQMLCCVPVV